MADSPIEIAVNLTEKERKEASSKYPGPTEFVHLHNHTLFSPLDGIATPGEYFGACAELGHPAFSITDHGSIANVPDAYWAANKNKVKFIPGCFLPDQPVLTSEGVISIKEIKPGMLVFTHKGRWRKVLNIQIRNYNGKLAVVDSWGSGKQIATTNHKYFIKTDQNQRLKYETNWIQLGDTKRQYYKSQPRSATSNNRSRWGYYLCVPKAIDIDFKEIDILSILNKNECNKYFIKEGILQREYKKPGFKTTKKYDSNDKILLDSEALWVIGAFLAEGSFAKTNGKIVSLTFSFGGSEINFASRVKNYFNSLGVNCYVHDRRPKRNLIEVEVYSTTIARAFKKLFKEGANHKQLPFEWINLPESKLKPLLCGLFDGDGKWKSDQSVIKLTSKTLIWQIRLMLAKIGCLSSVSVIKPGRPDQHESYSVRWRISGKTYCDQDDNYHYSPVKNTSRQNYNGIVYNIEVEEDHSYFTGVAVKNCEIYFSQEFPEFKHLKETDPDFKIGSLRPDYSKDVFELSDLQLEERYSSFRKFRHLSVLAKDMIGYRNLIQMTTEAWKIGFYYKPRIWFEQIEKYHEGLIILSGCLNGPICHNLRKAAFWGEIAKGKIDRIDRFLNKKKKIIQLNISKEEAAAQQKHYFGKTVEWINKFKNLMGDRFYLELQMPGDEIPFCKEAFRQIVWLSKKLNVKAVISNDCHYLSRPDFKVQKCMMAIDQQLTIDDPNLFHVNSDEQFFKSRAQLRKTFIENGYNAFATLEDFEEFCDNTVELSKRCSGFDPDLGPKLPKIDDAEVKLTQLVIQGLKDKGLYNNHNKYNVDGKQVTYKEQALIELKRYIDKGFASYFLIIRDLLEHSRGKGWDVGPGRGSAGGSLVCYLIGIHQLDPIKWGLSSVRFMGDSRGGHMLNIKME